MFLLSQEESDLILPFPILFVKDCFDRFRNGRHSQWSPLRAACIGHSEESDNLRGREKFRRIVSTFWRSSEESTRITGDFKWQGASVALGESRRRYSFDIHVRHPRHKKIPSIVLIKMKFLMSRKSLEALRNLHLAVELSEGKGKAGIQALCQRGALYRWMEQNDKAKEDFTRAAKAGSSFAKSQLVAMNPYAAMCNAMLREITCKTNYS